MTQPKKVFTTVALLFCGLIMTACPSLWKNAQLIKLYDSNGKVVGGIGGFKIHYAANADKDYTEDHYSIAITNANTGPIQKDSTVPIISPEDLGKVIAIGVAKTPDIYVTSASDPKYMCGQSIDPESPGFGCRFLSSSLANAKAVHIILKLKDGTFWKSEDLDLNKVTESTDVDADVNELLKGIGSGEVQMYTLKTCSDASGKKVDVKTSEDCPAGMALVIGEETKPDPADPADNTCAPPNFLDTTGKCVSVLQPQKTCDADSVTLLDGTCGAACGLSQVQIQGKCQCLKGYMKDDKGTGCVLDPAQDLTLPPASSSGGGSCSLIRTT